MSQDDMDLPDVYKDLLKRVEELEETLSKTAGVKQSAPVITEHSDELKADEVDEDELKTDKVVPVKLSSRAYLKMAVHAKKYANSNIKKKHWVEVIGLLTGHITNEDTPIEQIVINEAWAVGHGDAVSVQIMETNSVAQIMKELPKGDFIVGWYHSHPSYGNFLSIDDYNTQNRYQALWSKAIAIVIDPTQISPSQYGFGVFRNTTKEPGSKGYTELSAKVQGMKPSAAYEILTMIRPAYEEGQNLKFLEYE